jgi:hypothetical protein
LLFNAGGQYSFDRRHAFRFMALTTTQNTFAGMNPNCAVWNPITQTTTLLIPDKTQPSQQRRPIRTVEAIVNTQEI